MEGVSQAELDWAGLEWLHGGDIGEKASGWVASRKAVGLSLHPGFSLTLDESWTKPWQPALPFELSIILLTLGQCLGLHTSPDSSYLE